MKPMTLALIVALGAGSVALGAHQGTGSKSAQLRVTADVVKTCRVEVTPLAFGAYDPVAVNAAQPLDGTATLTVTCTPGTVVRVDLEQGQHNPPVTSSALNRAMAGPQGDLLTYGLYQDAARTQRWFMWVSGMKLPAAPNASPRAYTIYGRVPAAQGVPAGAYRDEVLASLWF